MHRRKQLIAGGALVAGLIAAGAGMAVAQGGGEGTEVDRPIPADALDRASSAALTHTGGGRVTETEVGDEEGYYEVEVTLPDGSQVDVHLDQKFAVLSTVTDKDQPDDE